MRMRMLLIWMVLLMAGSACAQPAEDDGKISVVPAFFPIAEAVERIGGDRVAVTKVTPPGAEPHDIELTTRALDAVIDADVVVYVGGGFQPSLEDAVGQAKGRVIDLLSGVKGDDPHIWLDPVVWSGAMKTIGGAFARADPGNGADYEGRAARYGESISRLDELFRKGLESCERNVVVTAHDAFGRLAKRYGLRQEGIAGISPEAEPDPKRLGELTDLVRSEDVTTIFTEELVSPKVADALAKEAGVTTAVLDPLESETATSYFDGMEENLFALRRALDCR